MDTGAPKGMNLNIKDLVLMQFSLRENFHMRKIFGPRELLPKNIFDPSEQVPKNLNFSNLRNVFNYKIGLLLVGI